MRKNAYYKDFEYMFVFSLGKPKTANILEDRRNFATGGRKASKMSGLGRTGDQKNQYVGLIGGIVPEYGRRGSVWYYNAGKYAGNLKGDLDYQSLAEHPAIFPQRLARDHILSWTNSGDLVIDPMVGNGTTLRAAADLERRAIGIEINLEYCELIRRRMAQSVLPLEG